MIVAIVAVVLALLAGYLAFTYKQQVDDWEAANNGGRPLNRLYLEGRLSRDRVHAELGDIVTGQRTGRESLDERILFNPMGLAIEDLACAVALYRRAMRYGLGRRLSLWQRPVFS